VKKTALSLGAKVDSCSMAEKAAEPEIQRTKDKEPVAP